MSEVFTPDGLMRDDLKANAQTPNDCPFHGWRLDELMPHDLMP